MLRNIYLIKYNIYYFYDLGHKNTSENLSLLKVVEVIRKQILNVSTCFYIILQLLI